MSGTKTGFKLVKDDRGRGSTYSVRVPCEEGQEQEVCLVERVFSGSRKWSIRLRHASVPEEIRHVQFGSKESAASFYVLYRKSVRAEVERHPLPEDVTDFLVRRSRHLHDRQKTLESELVSVLMDQRQLLEIARRYNLDEAAWAVEDSDVETAVKKLLEFSVPSPDKEEEGECPFFSEQCLYSLIGKEEARTVLALVRGVLKFVSPSDATGL